MTFVSCRRIRQSLLLFSLFGFAACRIGYGKMERGDQDGEGAQATDLPPLCGPGECQVDFGWAQVYGGKSYDDWIEALAVDPQDNLWVSGVVREYEDFDPSPTASGPSNIGDYDLFVLHLDSMGQHLYSNIYGTTGVDDDSSLAIDGLGQLHFTAKVGGGNARLGGTPLTANASGEDLVLATYGGGGEPIRSQVYGTNDPVWVGEIASAEDGSVVVTGSFRGTTSFGGTSLVSTLGGESATCCASEDAFVFRHAADGAHLWSMRLGGRGNDRSESVALDGAGNVYITGRFTNTVNFGGSDLRTAGSEDVFVASFDANGVHRWSSRFGGVEEDRGLALAADRLGNVYVAGIFRRDIQFDVTHSTQGIDDIFLVAFANDGQIRWSKTFGRLGSQNPRALALDRDGNVYMVGEFNGFVDFGAGSLVPNLAEGGFIATFAADGRLRWALPLLSPDPEVRDVAISRSGKVYAGGEFDIVLALGERFLQPLDTQGNLSDAFLVEIV